MHARWGVTPPPWPARHHGPAPRTRHRPHSGGVAAAAEESVAVPRETRQAVLDLIGRTQTLQQQGRG
ncbi:hypothetical protein [Nonomuraea gerenzanensis]|uniref:hypothetical protein n=1 Tax=Nonomuraea gerenzanensis TaxID=93944 RepID=UPI001CD99D40|nr:hypothetical protein [Nonomuraea gerenzanensis]UBU08652.1 hypothetical protein LCN96_30160 [Nonomuraea gerenzanensis]